MNLLSASMWIKGGNSVWGNGTHAPDDQEGTRHTHGHFFSFRAPTPESVGTSIPPGDNDHPKTISQPHAHPSMQPLDQERKNRQVASETNSHHTLPWQPLPPIPNLETSPGVGNLTADDASNWILEHTPNSWQRMIESNYSYGMERNEKQLKKNNLDHRKWTNPLEIQ